MWDVIGDIFPPSAAVMPASTLSALRILLVARAKRVALARADSGDNHLRGAGVIRGVIVIVVGSALAELGQELAADFPRTMDGLPQRNDLDEQRRHHGDEHHRHSEDEDLVQRVRQTLAHCCRDLGRELGQCARVWRTRCTRSSSSECRWCSSPWWRRCSSRSFRCGRRSTVLGKSAATSWPSSARALPTTMTMTPRMTPCLLYTSPSPRDGLLW